MRTSEQLDKIAAALLKFQTLTEPPVKNSTADTGKFKYDYADLCSLFAHCKKAMIECGLVFTSAGLTSRILHTSGQWIEGDFTVPDGLLPQQMGSAMTYGRRYNFQGLLGINAEEDDDGASSHPTTTKPTHQPGKLTTKPGGPVGGTAKPAPRPDAVGIVAAPDDERPPLRDEDNPEASTVADDGVAAYLLEAYTKERADKNGNTNRGVLLKTLSGEELGWHQCYEIASLPLIPKLKGKAVQAKITDEDGFKTVSHLKEAS